jgi:hypothetical protein
MEKNSQTRTISSQRQGWPLSFHCPEDWEVRELSGRNEVKFYLRGPLDPSGAMFASIIVRAWPEEEHTLSQLAQEWIGRRSAFRTFRLLARTETEVAGIEAIQIDAAHDTPLPLGVVNAKMTAVQERMIFALHGGIAYELTYRIVQSDFQEHLPTFEDLLASFSLEGEP